MVVSGRVHVVKLDSDTYTLFSHLKAAWGKTSMTQVAMELASRYKMEILKASGIRVEDSQEKGEEGHG